MAARKPDKAAAKALADLAAAKSALQRVQAAARLAVAADAIEHEAVAFARHAGATWTEIGAVYGMSKQAAQQRFRRAQKKTG